MAARRDTANLSLGAFLGLWGFSAIHALVNKPGASTASLPAEFQYAQKEKVDDNLSFGVVLGRTQDHKGYSGILSIKYRH